MKRIYLSLIAFLFLGYLTSIKAEELAHKQVIVNDSSYRLSVRFFNDWDLRTNYRSLNTYFFNKDSWSTTPSKEGWITLARGGGCRFFEDQAVIQIAQVFTLDDRDAFSRLIDVISLREYPDEKYYDLLGMWNNLDNPEINFHRIRNVEDVEISEASFLKENDLSDYKIFIEASQVDNPKCP